SEDPQMASSRKFRKASGRRFAEFGFSAEEIFRCTVCDASGPDALEQYGRTLTGFVLPITDLAPVAGVLGLGWRCAEYATAGAVAGRRYRWLPVNRPDGSFGPEERTWRPPVALDQPVAGEPVHVLQRNPARDERLRATVGRVWAGLPEADQAAMRRHLS